MPWKEKKVASYSPFLVKLLPSVGKKWIPSKHWQDDPSCYLADDQDDAAYKDQAHRVPTFQVAEHTVIYGYQGAHYL